MKKNILFLLASFLVVTSCKKETEEIIKIIQLSPDSTITIYASDFFDNYRIVHIDDEDCMIVNDFAFFKDKIVANIIQFGSMPAARGLASKLRVFDYTGNFLYQIGDIGKGHGEYLSAGKVVSIERDSTITVLNNTQILNYNIDNTLNYSRLFYSTIMGNRVNTSLGENYGAINDSCVLMIHPLGEYGNYKFITTSKDGERVFHGFFDEDQNKSHGFPLLYRYEGKINYYNEDDHSIYGMYQDTAIVRYHLVSNKPNGEFAVGSIIETKQYIFLGNGVLYNKKNGESFHYHLIDDMVLPKGMTEDERTMRYSTTRNGNFNTHIFFELKYSPHRHVLRNTLDSLKDRMSPKEWEEYATAKPDVIEVYNRLPQKPIGEISIPVLFGYTIKDDI